jgi:hypothetical protein
MLASLGTGGLFTPNMFRIYGIVSVFCCIFWWTALDDLPTQLPLLISKHVWQHQFTAWMAIYLSLPRRSAAPKCIRCIELPEEDSFISRLWAGCRL